MIQKFLTRFVGESYQARSFRGSAFTFLQFGAQNFLRLASNLILTRILFPEAFGLMALTQVLIAGVSLFSVIGIRGSIIQEGRETTPSFLHTAWTIAVLRGIFLTLVILLVAKPFSGFYAEPMLFGLLMINGWVPAIRGFTSIRMLTAQREIQLGRLTAITIGVQALALLIMVGLAWWMQTVWALAIGNVVNAALLVVASHVFLPGPRDRFGFDRKAGMEIFNFGRWIILATIAAFFIQQGDKAVLGKFVSLETLSLYNIAFFLAAVPAAFGLALIDRVIYPLYARRPPAESEANRRKIFKARWGITGLLMAGSIVLALIGDPLVHILYDPRYEAAGAMLALIALASLPGIVVQSYEKLPLAAGHSARFAIYKITYAMIDLAFLCLGVIYFGIGGAIAARAIAVLVSYPLLILAIRPYKGWDVRHDAIYFSLAGLATITIFWFAGATTAPLFVTG